MRWDVEYHEGVVYTAENSEAGDIGHDDFAVYVCMDGAWREIPTPTDHHWDDALGPDWWWTILWDAETRSHSDGHWLCEKTLPDGRECRIEVRQ